MQLFDYMGNKEGTYKILFLPRVCVCKVRISEHHYQEWKFERDIVLVTNVWKFGKGLFLSLTPPHTHTSMDWTQIVPMILTKDKTGVYTSI